MIEVGLRQPLAVVGLADLQRSRQQITKTKYILNITHISEFQICTGILENLFANKLLNVKHQHGSEYTVNQHPVRIWYNNLHMTRQRFPPWILDSKSHCATIELFL